MGQRDSQTRVRTSVWIFLAVVTVLTFTGLVIYQRHMGMYPVYPIAHPTVTQRQIGVDNPNGSDMITGIVEPDKHVSASADYLLTIAVLAATGLAFVIYRYYEHMHYQHRYPAIFFWLRRKRNF